MLSIVEGVFDERVLWLMDMDDECVGAGAVIILEECKNM